MAKWNSGDKPNKSIYLDRQRHYPPNPMKIDLYKEETWNKHEDYVIVLYPFSQLRNARSAEVCRPVDLIDANDFGRSVAMNMEEKEPVGTYLNPDDPWDDAAIQQEIDQIYMDLDLDLDLLPGPTANMMRLERFSSWYTDKLGGESHYERENERIIRSWTDERACSRRTWSLYRRHASMIAFSPISTKTRHPERKPSKVETCLSALQKVKSVEGAVDPSLIDEGWEQDGWHNGGCAWMKGIAPLNSEESFLVMKLTHHRAVRENYEAAFEKRVRSWVSENVERYRADDCSELELFLRSVPKSDITGICASEIV